MQIHELNNYSGNLDANAYVAVDNGSDTGKVSSTDFLAGVEEEITQLDTTLNARIDNIIGGGSAPSAAEVTDARLGASALGSVQYSTLGEAIRGQVTEIQEEFENILVVPEATNFADRINSTGQLFSFSDSTLGIQKLSNLVPYNGKLITSSGSDTYFFRLPHGTFTFALEETSTVYVLNKEPQGEANETLSIADTITGTGSNSWYTFTINEPKGAIVIFGYRKIDSGIIRTAVLNHFTEEGLELNNVQDNFLRYAEIGSDSDYIPLTITKLSGKLVSATNGTVSDSESYDTYYFKCPVSLMSVTCNNATRAVITAIAPDAITMNGYLIESKYAYPADRVETFNVQLGTYVVFSVSTAEAKLNLKTNYVKTFVLPTLRLAYGQKNSFYQFEKSGSATYLYIFVVSGSHLVRWQLHNVPSAGINSDTWQLGHVMGYDFDGREVSNGVELVAGGEFELAFKEYGADDYCGGNNHGDENTIDFTLLIDGEKIDLTSVDSDYHSFDRIKAIEHAYVNRCDTPGDNILEHQKIWIFENGSVKVMQSLEFLEDLACDFLCCMFAANRAYYTHGVRQGRVGTEVMTTSSFPDVQTDGNEMSYVMYGDHASAKISAKTCDHSPVSSLWVNPAATINKLYYNFFTRLPNTSVEQGTVYWWESEYDVAYNG